MASKEPFGLTAVAASPSTSREKTIDGVASAIHKSADMLQEAAVTACDSKDIHLVWHMVNTERMLRRMASNLQRQYK